MKNHWLDCQSRRRLIDLFMLRFRERFTDLTRCKINWGGKLSESIEVSCDVEAMIALLKECYKELNGNNQ